MWGLSLVPCVAVAVTDAQCPLTSTASPALAQLSCSAGPWARPCWEQPAVTGSVLCSHLELPLLGNKV